MNGIPCRRGRRQRDRYFGCPLFRRDSTACSDNQRHHPSTHFEFVPLPNEVELDRVKAIYVKNNSTVAVCPIEISVWDNNADVAVVKVIAPNPGHSLFEDFFWLTGDIPKVGEEIAMIGYGEMQELVDLDTPNVGKLKRRLVLRVGRVHAIHSNGCQSAFKFDPRIASSANVTLIAQSVLTIRRRLIG